MENNNHTPHESMQESILRKIRMGQVSQRPRLYFTLKVAVLALLAVAIVLVSVSIFNFILFSIRINSHDSLLGFGPRGLEVFLQLFPWPLLLIDIVLVFLLEWLLRQFRFGYAVPVLYLLCALLGITTAAAALIDRATDINDRLLHRADNHELFFFGEFLEQARRPMPGSGICVCTITAVQAGTLTVADTRSGSTTELVVQLPSDDPRATTTGLKVGDVVFIAGDSDDGVIRAFGVRKVPPQGLPPLPSK